MEAVCLADQRKREKKLFEYVEIDFALILLQKGQMETKTNQVDTPFEILKISYN